MFFFPFPFHVPGYGLPYSYNGNGNSILWLLSVLYGSECWRSGVVAGDGNEFVRRGQRRVITPKLVQISFLLHCVYLYSWPSTHPSPGEWQRNEGIPTL